MIQKILGPHWRTTLAGIGVFVGTAGYVVQTELAGGHLSFFGVLKVAAGLAGSYGLWNATDWKALSK